MPVNFYDMEEKVRHVASPKGVAHFGLPIGSPILPGMKEGQQALNKRILAAANAGSAPQPEKPKSKKLSKEESDLLAEFTPAIKAKYNEMVIDGESVREIHKMLRKEGLLDSQAKYLTGKGDLQGIRDERYRKPHGVSPSKPAAPTNAPASTPTGLTGPEVDAYIATLPKKEAYEMSDRKFVWRIREAYVRNRMQGMNHEIAKETARTGRTVDADAIAKKDAWNERDASIAKMVTNAKTALTRHVNNALRENPLQALLGGADPYELLLKTELDRVKALQAAHRKNRPSL